MINALRLQATNPSRLELAIVVQRKGQRRLCLNAQCNFSHVAICAFPRLLNNILAASIISACSVVSSSTLMVRSCSSLLVRDWTLGPGPPSSTCWRAWSAREGRC